MARLNDPGLLLRLHRALGIKGERFVLPELDDTLVPVIVMDQVLPDDPRVSLTRDFFFGPSYAVGAPTYNAVIALWLPPLVGDPQGGDDTVLHNVKVLAMGTDEGGVPGFIICRNRTVPTFQSGSPLRCPRPMSALYPGSSRALVQGAAVSSAIIPSGTDQIATFRGTMASMVWIDIGTMAAEGDASDVVWIVSQTSGPSSTVAAAFRWQERGRTP